MKKALRRMGNMPLSTHQMLIGALIRSEKGHLIEN